MSRVSMSPFPRFDSTVEWSEISASIDGHRMDLGELADRWDADSAVDFEVTAAMPQELHTELGSDRIRLVLTGGSSSTGVSVTSESAFIRGSTRSSAAATISIPGSVLADRVDIRATVIAPHMEIPWLSRRVIAERRPERVSLDSSMTGFPTVSISFNENSMIDAPWQVKVSAASLTDPFAHSVQLILNDDYPRVVALIEGRAEPYVESALERAILRTLIQTIARLSAQEMPSDSLGAIAAEHPESIAAAAAKACSDYLQRDLASVISMSRTRPEDVEMWMAAATHAMKEKRK